MGKHATLPEATVPIEANDMPSVNLMGFQERKDPMQSYRDSAEKEIMDVCQEGLRDCKTS
jgi:hypothetical protein